MALKSPRGGVQSIRRRYSAALGSFPSRSFYVDATLGNDANSGTYPDEAWQSEAPVNGGTFLPGDRIRLKRGETLNGTITIPSAGIPERLITLGAYGSGIAPVLNGGANAAIQVTAADRGYWRIQDLDLRCTGDVEDGARGIHHRAGAGWDENVPGWIVENNVLNCGVKIRGANSIIRRNAFDGAGNGEAKHMINIEESLSTSALIEWNTVANCLGRGIWLLGTGSNPIVRNNTVHDVAADAPAEGYGIDIDGYASVISGALVENNRVYATDGASIELENCDGSPIVRNNIVSGAGEDGIEIIAYDAHDAVPDMRGVDVSGLIYNNLVYECWRGIAVFLTAGWEFYHNTIADGGPGPGLMIWYDTGVQSQVAGLIWKNNIISGHAEAITARHDIDILDTQDYNLYFNGNFTVDNPFSARNFAQYQIDTGQEANSDLADPDFVNPGADDYHLLVASPCVGAGVNVGITEDLDGVARPEPPTQPDIGAYQFVP